jgi:hypothetical protein
VPTNPGICTWQPCSDVDSVRFNSPIMHFLGHLVLALAIIIAAMIVSLAFRFTPVVERVPGVVSGTSYDEIRSFDHWTGQHH